MNNIVDVLGNYYRTKDTRDLAALFERYMIEIGARKLDRRNKDTSNTYKIDGNSTNWNRVECYYYRNNGAWQKYGEFEFCITLRKRSGSYLLIEVGSPNCKIERPYEISYGEVIHYNEELLTKLVKQHPKLFEMISKECD